jgi:23S rRNA (cytosine1962-C5)-methyltransferase
MKPKVKSSINDYELLDCGEGQKLEQFGRFRLVRPCAQALWQKVNPKLWTGLDAQFIRTGDGGERGIWKVFNAELSENLVDSPKHGYTSKVLKPWVIEGGGLKWQIEPNDFGNMGVFTEHWQYAYRLPALFGKVAGKELEKEIKVLNLFSYTGSNIMFSIRAGLKVTAVDSSKNAMTAYNKNMELNGLSREGQRLILEDASKFMQKEERRGVKYDAVVMDAPSYGRGTKKEVFTIEDDLLRLIFSAQKLLTKEGKLVMTVHSPRFTPKMLEILLGQTFKNKKVEVEEIINPCRSGVGLPSGILCIVE